MIALTVLSISLYGQGNPDKITDVVVQGESWSYSFLSSSPIRNINVSSASGELTIQDPSNGFYDTEYLSDADFEGRLSWVVEYTNFFGEKRYTEIQLDVVQSIIRAESDFGLVAPGESSVFVDLLANDVSSSGGLEITGLDLVQNGTATINGSGVDFVANDGFSGITHFNYLVRDESGSTSAGNVTINVASQNPDLSDRTYTITNTSYQDIVFPGAGFSLTDSEDLVIGSLNSLSKFSVRYSPLEFSDGLEQLVFENSDGNQIKISIEVINNQELIDIVVDDKIYTSRGQVVAFDPLANDYNKNVVIINHSAELSNASGLLVYQPHPGFSGVKRFFYTVHDGASTYTGSIDVFVGDYLPAKPSYEFVTKQNIPLVLEYNVPIKNFAFKTITNPQNGQVRTNLGQVSTSCESTNGYKLIEYAPNSGFVGTDEFIVEYCVINGACQNVTIQVEVVASDDDCGCIGSGCIWPGDADNDGQVTMQDLLPLGYHYGQSGPARNGTEDEWTAQKVDNWTFDQDNGVNRKFADSDGNGIVTTDDMDAISTNYQKYHNLTAEHVLEEKDITITAVYTSAPFRAGDVETFEIFFGSEENPVTDLQGLTFDIKVPSLLVAPNSMEFIPSDDGLLSSGGPVMTMHKESSTGTMAVGAVKTLGTVSGNGHIGTTRITGQIDIDGLRPGERIIPFTFKIGESLGSDSNGELYRLKGSTLTLEVDIVDEKSNEPFDHVEVVSFPNPSSGLVHFHANNYDQIKELTLFNTVGERVFYQDNIDNKRYSLSKDLSQGFYLAHITTEKGKSVQKIQIIKD